jgi:ABC-type sugar transport system substrate-binding protein
MIMVRKKKCKTPCTIALAFLTVFLLIAVGSRSDAGAAEKPEGEGKAIGVIYRATTSAFIYNSIEYQCFYESFQRHLKDLADKHGYRLVENQGGLYATYEVQMVNSMIQEEVDGIIFCLSEPPAASIALKDAREAGIPIVFHGVRPPEGLVAHYVGYEEYATCKKLGRRTARFFKRQFPEREATLLVVNTGTIKRNVERENGFVDGFTQVIAEARVVSQPDDDGSVHGSRTLTQASLVAHPEINVLFGTSDLRAQGALTALRMYGRDTITEAVLAGVGGGELAMREIINPSSPWKAEVGLSIEETARKSFNLLMDTIKGNVSMDEKKEILVQSKVFVDPSREQIQRYLRNNFRLVDFFP